MQTSTMRHLRARVRASGRRYWTTEELLAGVASRRAGHAALTQLTRSGELQRVRRGLYWRRGRVTDARTATPVVRGGMSLAKKLCPGVACGLGGWHATNALGLSTQVSPVDVIAVSARPPRAVAGVRFLDRSARVGRTRQRLVPLEVTILEALGSWHTRVELPADAALQAFIAILAREDVRVAHLARASDTEPPAVRERLRAVLIAGGWEDEAARIQRAATRATRERALKVLAAR